MSDRDVARFDRLSTTYDRSPAQRLFFTRVHSAVADMLADAADPPRRIVDVGCGTGRLLTLLHQRFPDADLIGVDPAEGMIREARRRFIGEPAVRLEIALARALPLEDGSADAVTSSVSFHHWDDQAASLREIARVLRGGGRLLLADIFGIGPVGRLLDRLGHRHGRGYRSQTELSTLLVGAGLSWVRRRQLFGPGSPISVVEARRDLDAAT